MNKNAQNPGFAKKSSIVSYTDANGAQKTIDASTIANWKTHHGTASCGTKVHSLSSSKMGRSTIIKDSKGDYSSFLTAELEVMSTQLFGNTNATTKK